MQAFRILLGANIRFKEKKNPFKICTHVRIDNFWLKMIAKIWKKVYNSIDVKCSQMWSHFHGFPSIWCDVVWDRVMLCTLHIAHALICCSSLFRLRPISDEYSPLFQTSIIEPFRFEEAPNLAANQRTLCILWCQ